MSQQGWLQLTLMLWSNRSKLHVLQKMALFVINMTQCYLLCLKCACFPIHSAVLSHVQ